MSYKILWTFCHSKSRQKNKFVNYIISIYTSGNLDINLFSYPLFYFVVFYYHLLEKYNNQIMLTKKIKINFHY